MKKLYAIVLLVFLVWVGFIYAKVRDVSLWHEAKGTILSTSLDVRYSPNFINPKERIRSYGAQVRYAYFVDGKRYVSRRVSFADKHSRKSKDVLKVINKYRKHQEPKVYYNPKDPRRSALETNGIWQPWFLLMIAGLLGILGLIVYRPKEAEVLVSKFSLHVQQGFTYQSKGKLNEALAEYNKAIEIDPGSSVGYSYRGIVYFLKGDLDLAIANFDEALKIDDKDELAQFARKKATREKEKLMAQEVKFDFQP